MSGTTGGPALADVLDALADAVPDRELLVCGDVRRTCAEVARRTRGLATFLASRGLGLHRERHELERWECGQDRVALVLQNGTEYLEAMYGAFRARAVPFNVNQHYRPAEVGGLLGDVGPRAVVYHRAFGPLLDEAVDTGALVLIDVDDGSGVPPLSGSTSFEDAVATPAVELPAPSPDDLWMVCTGGTTGRPKAVLWRQTDAFVSALGGQPGATAQDVASAAAAGTGSVWFAAPPLMHAASQMTAFCGIHAGGTIVTHDDRGPFDPHRLLQVVEREHVFLMSVVGDAFLRPMVDAQRDAGYDLSSLHVLGVGGAATSAASKEAFLELVPHLTIMDGYGSSETGGMAFRPRTRDGEAEGFGGAAGAAVVSADRDRFLTPGEEEIGWLARRGHVPLGYLGDRAKTEETFPVVEGERVVVPGDRAQVLADGTLRMLGRDSLVINTGGEKVFVEEVETVLCEHPDVADALVVGRPSERFGQEVVAVVAAVDGRTLDPVALREHVAERIARFKAPRAVAICPTVQRHANGKADYVWAREAAESATSVVR